MKFHKALLSRDDIAEKVGNSLIEKLIHHITGEEFSLLPSRIDTSVVRRRRNGKFITRSKAE